MRIKAFDKPIHICYNICVMEPGMNKQSFNILNILYDNCPDDGYKIVDINDIILALPKGENYEIDKLFKLIEDLATDGSIDLKYRDDEDICYALTLKGRRIVKKERETKSLIEAEKKSLEEQEKQLIEEKELMLIRTREAIDELKKDGGLKSASRMRQLKRQLNILEKELYLLSSEDTSAVEVRMQHMDFVPLVKKVGKVAFWGGLIGALIGNTIFFVIRLITGN